MNHQVLVVATVDRRGLDGSRLNRRAHDQSDPAARRLSLAKRVRLDQPRVQAGERRGRCT
jgi:hypothetical protein